MTDDKIYGRNPVLEALESGREVDKVLIRDGLRGSQISEIIQAAKSRGIMYRFVAQAKLDSAAEGENHQGVVAYAAAHTYCSVEDILADAESKQEPPFVVLCDGISDPHNLGSIIRSANAAGVHGVIIPKNRSVGLTATVAKVSAGAIEHTKVARVTNIAQTIKRLKDAGLWIVGTDLSGTMSMYECDMTGAIGVVIGSEGEGMSRIVRDSCDYLVKIPMFGQTESLNASVAAGVLFYEKCRQSRFANNKK